MLLASLCALALATTFPDAVKADEGEESAQAPAEGPSTKWFEEAKFGLFIHWGLFSEAAGYWGGKRYYGITEWVMRRGRIPTKDYAELAQHFNPTEFDAKEWVEFAKQAGVKYIVITAKHHDGFAMYDSAVSDFDIVDATPYGRDPLKELAREAAKAGIKLGFYYSQYQDWVEPNAGGNEWEFAVEGRDFAEYQERKAKPQLKELLTNYGDVGIIWFDTPGDSTKEQARDFLHWVRTSQPNTLVSSRVGHGLGDYINYGDAEVPDIPELGRPWEAIYTHNDTWGFSAFDSNYKSSGQIIRMLSNIAGKGGNLMLNIGPDGKGRLPQGSAEPILEAGEWLRANGESIYGTKASPFGPLPWGTATRRGGRLYLHVTERPASGQILVPNVPESVTLKSARFLVGGKAVSWERRGSDLIVGLPEKLGKSPDHVIVIEHSGAFPDFEHPVTTIVSQDFDETRLLPAFAQLQGGVNLAKLSYYHYFGDWKTFETLESFSQCSDRVTWDLRVTEPGDYKIVLDYNAMKGEAGREGFVDVGGKSFAFQVLLTDRREGEWQADGPAPFIDHDIGIVSFDKPGKYTLSLRPRQDSGNLFTLRSVRLDPVD